MLQKTEAKASSGRKLLLDVQAHKGSLRQAQLQGVDGRGLEIPDGTDFYVASLHGVDFSESDLPNANLYGANAPESVWTHANISGSDARHVDFSGSIFFEASLQNVNARRANFSGCDLRGADLTGADLGSAQLGNVTFDESTIWPESIAPAMAQILDDSIEEVIKTPVRFTLDSDGLAPGGLSL